jgi:hypothetical protein
MPTSGNEAPVAGLSEQVLVRVAEQVSSNFEIRVTTGSKNQQP